MKSNLIIILLLVLLLSNSYIMMATSSNSQDSLSQSTLDIPSQQEVSNYLNNIREFVVSQYSAKFNMVAETPDLFPQSHTYWIAHDNLLAYYFLSSTHTDIANLIKSQINQYASEYGLELNADGMPRTYKIDGLFNKTINFPIHTPNIYTFIDNSTFVLKSEISNGTGIFYDWFQYGDLTGYTILDFLLRGDHGMAYSNFTANYLTKWDGTGIADVAMGTRYETFKLSLFLLTGLKLYNLGYVFSEWNTTLTVLMDRQLAHGGIITHYNPDGSNPLVHQGVDANIETSIITAYAMTYLLSLDLLEKSSNDSSEQTNTSKVVIPIVSIILGGLLLAEMTIRQIKSKIEFL